MATFGRVEDWKIALLPIFSTQSQKVTKDHGPSKLYVSSVMDDVKLVQ